MSDCPSCGAGLETSLACFGCGVLLSQEGAFDPFAVMGLVPSFELDEADLTRRLRRISRATHPDYFGTGSEEMRALAEHNNAALNAAYALLSSPVGRADWLVKSLGGPDENEQREMPQAFLMEVLEWNETLEEARGAAPASPERAALEALRATLSGERAGALESIGNSLTPLPPTGSPTLQDVRKELNALRYIDRTLAEIEALRLEQAASR